MAGRLVDSVPRAIRTDTLALTAAEELSATTVTHPIAKEARRADALPCGRLEQSPRAAGPCTDRPLEGAQRDPVTLLPRHRELQALLR
jgi:hypothetical protein